MYYSDRELRSLLGSQRTNADLQLRLESLESRQWRFHDVFLSHSRLDAEVILGLKRVLETLKLSVYVDWIDDPMLDRSNVTPATADHLRVRMENCETLLYAYSRAASRSAWMPWELGYFDGRKGGSKVAVCPIDSTSPAVEGQEYVGLYSTFEKIPLPVGHRAAFVSPTGRSEKTASEFVRGQAGSVFFP